MSYQNMKIVADSSADTLTIDTVPFASAPLKIITNEKEYIDDAALDVAQMANDLYIYSGKSRSACPGTGDWLEAFGEAQYVFCVTITSGLSGSYNSAESARQIYEENHPDRKVFVIDSLSAGPELRLIIEKLQELITAGKSFDEICTHIKEYQNQTGLIFSLESVRNLANNGRVSHLVASAVGILNIRILGRASAEGTLEQLYKVRGEKKALPMLVKMLHDHHFNGQKIRIYHCLNEAGALKFKDLVLADFPAAQVEVGHLRGLCSFYAERGGILIGYEKEKF